MAPGAVDSPEGTSAWADGDQLRTDFTLALSAMYKGEVPLYGDLVRIVAHVNHGALDGALDPRVLAIKHGDVASSRLDIERHGAIRLGTAQELRTMRRLFALIGLHPVGYYDLSAAGLPMHATCFRPRSQESLRRNPFRVFTSVLRPELVRDRAARTLALDLLSRRDIFSHELMRLLDTAEANRGRLTVDQGRRFIDEAVKTFSWHDTAAATYDEYACLQAEHPILADMACFRSAHINHLTPRTLSIEAARDMMKAEGLRVKDRIEGPPPRNCPILLRQTSFLAIQEPVHFLPSGAPGSPLVRGSHRARFGEIEERGAAVTPAGRRLYDELLDEAMASAKAGPGPVTADKMDAQVEQAFAKYPDDWDELRRRGLIYCAFRCTDKGAVERPPSSRSYDVEELIDRGTIEAVPVTYEDFLPLSAAAIFQSNLGAASPDEDEPQATTPDVEGMEEALGVGLGDPDELYRQMQRESLEECASKLDVRITCQGPRKEGS